MDWSSLWEIARVVLAVLAVCLAAAAGIIVWRIKGILSWKRSLKEELRVLEVEAGAGDGPRRKARDLVLQRCRLSLRSLDPDPGELAGVLDFVRSIAACYHPDAERPELRITAGRLLVALRKSIDRLDLITYRPGFRKLRHLRIRHIRRYYEWYLQLSRNPMVRRFWRHRKSIGKVSRLRLLVFPDPFSLLAFLSNKLTLLILTRCLLTDVLLFVGKTALAAYEPGVTNDGHPEEPEELEKTLEDLDKAAESLFVITDPGILEIRNRLVGFPAFLISPPGLKEWKGAVEDAARIMARKYFPDAQDPLEEAAIGPIMERAKAWVQAVCETEERAGFGRLHGISFESLYRVKSLADSFLNGPLGALTKRSRDMYRWLKWPLQLYRSVRKASPAGIAVTVGWAMARKGFVNFVCRYTFDLACREIEMVYRDSRGSDGNRKLEKPQVV